MVRNTHTAQDITQEVFLKYYQLSLKNKSCNSSYLYCIAHSKCIDLLRRKKIERMYVNVLRLNDREQQTSSIPEEDEELSEILNKLKAYEKSVLLLKAVHGFSHKEIANILGKNESSIRKQYSRVQSKVRRMFERKEDCECKNIIHLKI